MLCSKVFANILTARWNLCHLEAAFSYLIRHTKCLISAGYFYYAQNQSSLKMCGISYLTYRCMGALQNMFMTISFIFFPYGIILLLRTVVK